jgi:hypothetical protein
VIGLSAKGHVLRVLACSQILVRGDDGARAIGAIDDDDGCGAGGA